MNEGKTSQSIHGNQEIGKQIPNQTNRKQVCIDGKLSS